jgi:hypothetical protein
MLWNSLGKLDLQLLVSILELYQDLISVDIDHPHFLTQASHLPHHNGLEIKAKQV